MNQEALIPQLTQRDFFIKRICKIIFFTHLWICTIPIYAMVILRDIHSLLNSSKSDPTYFLPLFTLIGATLGFALTFYIYKKIYKQYGYWLLIIGMALVLYGLVKLPYFQLVNTYYENHVSLFKCFHFNPGTLKAISICMQVIGYVYTLSGIFLLWINMKYHIERRKLKKKLQLEEKAEKELLQ